MECLEDNSLDLAASVENRVVLKDYCFLDSFITFVMKYPSQLLHCSGDHQRREQFSQAVNRDASKLNQTVEADVSFDLGGGCVSVFQHCIGQKN